MEPKILSQIPKNFLSAKNVCSSRLGMQVEGISLADLSKKPHGIVVFGLPDDSGIANVGGRTGAKLGPAQIREKLYRFTVQKKFSFPIYDLGDLSPSSEISTTHALGAAAIAAVHSAGHLPIVLGGGHDLAFAEALALMQSFKQTEFINIDAHLDLRSTENGITSGSPWYLLCEHPLFKARRGKLTEFGIQDQCNSKALFEYAEQQRDRVKIYRLQGIKAHNRPKVFQGILKAQAKHGKVQVSLDIDSIRMSEAPGCSAPQVVGFTAEEALAMCEETGKTAASFGVYEVSPPLDRDGQTAALAAHCIFAFLRGYGVRVSKQRKQSKKAVS